MKVGILGGGQLALMLVEAAKKLGIDVGLFVASMSEPAVAICSDVTCGKFSREALGSFIKGKTHIIFESEFVDGALLREVGKGSDSHFYPELSVMEQFQDKLSQKKFCERHKIPTSDFRVYDGLDVASWSQKVISEFSGKCVFKWARLGYDGKGNFFVNGSFDRNLLNEFIESAVARGSDIYAEKLVAFEQELAIVAIRSTQSEIRTYPVVVSEQRDGICLNVKGPAISLGLPAHISDQVISIAKKIGNEGGIVGAYAVELFLRAGEVYVNEIAPRVHNTGHYTQDACSASQFENHLRACCGLEVGETTTTRFFAMRNILGPIGKTVDSAPLPIPSKASILHWYGKFGIKPGRKLGHFNTTAESVSQLEENILILEQDDTRWANSF